MVLTLMMARPLNNEGENYGKIHKKRRSKSEKIDC